MVAACEWGLLTYLSSVFRIPVALTHVGDSFPLQGCDDVIHLLPC